MIAFRARHMKKMILKPRRVRHFPTLAVPMMFQLHIFVPLKVATLGFGSFGELRLVFWGETRVLRCSRNEETNVCHSIYYLTHWTRYPIRHLTQCHCAYCPYARQRVPTTHLALQGREPVQSANLPNNAVKHASRPNPGSQAQKKTKKKSGQGVRPTATHRRRQIAEIEGSRQAFLTNTICEIDIGPSVAGPCMTRHADFCKKAKAKARGHGYYCKVRRAEMVGGVAWKELRTEVWAFEKKETLLFQ